jgi:multiple sugar transport system permease protein
MEHVNNKPAKVVKNALKNKGKTAYLYFLLPSFITIIVIMIVPFLYSVFITLNDVNLLENGGKFSFAGLGNYFGFFKDERALHSILTTLKFVMGALFAETILGLAISLFLDRRFRGKMLIRGLLIIPMFMTPVVSGLIWRTFYDPTAGLINYAMGMIGLGNAHDWLGNTLTALPCLIVTDAWQWTPFMILLYSASLDAIPIEIYEATYLESASELQIIRYIKLPLLLPTIFIAVILRAIDAIKAFDIIYVMTKGGPGLATETINMYSYIVGFNFFKIGYATTMSFIFTIFITIVLSIITTRLTNRANTLNKTAV